MSRVFHYNFGRAIWRMDIEEKNELLAFELRSRDNGNPFFAVLSYADGQLKMPLTAHGDRWWTLAGITSECLLTHCYNDPSQPGTGSLTALNFDGSIRWERPHLRLAEILENGIMVRSMHGLSHQLHLLDLSGNEISLQENDQWNQNPSRNIRYPSLLSDATPPIPLPVDSVGPVHQLILDKTTILYAFHSGEAGAYQLQLLVDRNGTFTTRILAENLAALLPETFFAVGRQIFYITNNKQEIASYFV